MSDKVVVNLQVAGRNLPLEVPEAESSLLQQAAHLLEEKLGGLSGSSTNLESRLLLTALDLAGDYLRAEEARKQAEQQATEVEQDQQLQQSAASQASALSEAALSRIEQLTAQLKQVTGSVPESQQVTGSGPVTQPEIAPGAPGRPSRRSGDLKSLRRSRRPSRPATKT